MHSEKLMPSFTEHYAETTAVLGQPFDGVHLWLDVHRGQP